MQTPSRVAVVFVTLAGFLFLGAGAAMADAPATWLDPEPTSHLHELLFFGGSTVALIVGISLFALLTARNNYTPPPPGTDVEVRANH